MSTASLRKDHDLIEKAIKAMGSTIELLKNGKTIPQPILENVIDFSKNFTDVCHHGKEENSLFPALEKAGMPTNMGPIAIMLMDHEQTRKIANQMEISSKHYIETGDSSQLISDMEAYVTHVTEHLWKENNRLFMMAEARLQYAAKQVDAELNEIEDAKLKEIGKSRADYEKLVDDLEKSTQS